MALIKITQNVIKPNENYDTHNIDSTGIITATQLNVGTGVTISGGIVTATSFSGDGSGLSGIDATSLKDSGGTIRAQANTSGVVVTGVVTATSFSGNMNATGLTGTPDIDVRNITGVAATFTSDVNISDSIIHIGDTNTKIRFPADDTVSIETSGSERLSINSSGRQQGHTDYGAVGINTFASWARTGGAVRAEVGYNAVTTDYMYFGTGTNHPVALRVNNDNALYIKNDSSRSIGIGTDNPGMPLEVLTENSTLGIRINRFASGSYYSDIIHTTTSGTEALAFKIGDGSTVTERLRITDVGDVGIGTDNPGTLTWRTGNALDVFAGAGNASGHLYLGANRGDGTQTVGSIVFYDNTQTASHQNVAIIEVDKAGSGTNTRGGDFLFYNKADAGTSTPVTFKIRSGGNCEIPDGNLTFASGHGIDFSATSDVGGMTSELLDDYEEGAWTPAWQGTVNSGTFTAVGSYVKIGRLVTAEMKQTGGVVSAGAGAYIVSGCPFSPNGGSGTNGAAGTWTDTSPQQGGQILVWSNGRLYTSSAISNEDRLVLSMTWQTND